MKLPNLFLLLIILFSSSVIASVQTLNFPANGEYLAQSKIELNLTSDANTTGCYWNYNNVRNETINCEGLSSITLPLKNGQYTINVGDDTGSTISHSITLAKANSGFSYFIYLVCISAILFNFFMVIYHIIQLGDLQTGLKDVFYAWTGLFVTIIFNFLFEEYVAVTYMVNIFNTFQLMTYWATGFLPILAWLVCGLIRTMNPKLAMKKDQQRGII